MTDGRGRTFAPEVASPYWLGEGDRGVLLLHGFAGTPPEMRPLAEKLAERGIVAYAPLLAGHGTTPEELEQTTFRDWAGSANSALDELLRRCRVVGVAGQSGGGTLALQLAATRPEVRAVVCQAALIWMHDWRVRALPLLRWLIRWDVPSGEVDLYNREAIRQLHSYRRRPTAAILQLVRLAKQVRRDLPAVSQPLLLFQGDRDTVVDPANAPDILAAVSSEVRALVRLSRSGHGISVDVDRDRVARLGAEWMERYLTLSVDAELSLPTAAS